MKISEGKIIFSQSNCFKIKMSSNVSDINKMKKTASNPMKTVLKEKKRK